MFDVLIEYSRMLMWKLNNIANNIVSNFEIEIERGWDGLIHVLKFSVDGSLLSIENTCYGDIYRYVNCNEFKIELITSEGFKTELEKKDVEKDEQIKKLINEGINKIKNINDFIDGLLEISSKVFEKKQPNETIKQIINFLTTETTVPIREIEEFKQKIQEYENKVKQLEKEVNELRKYKEKIETFVKQLNINELNKIINEYKDRLKKPTFIKAIGGNTAAQKLSKIINTLEELLILIREDFQKI